MIPFSVHLSNYGDGTAPTEWWLYPVIRIQRLYYIKSGSGFYLGEDGRHLPFIPGKIYITPYNLHDSFQNSSDDPIDHVYFDFITTPPIIAPEPLIYDVPFESSIQAMMTLIRYTYAEAATVEKRHTPEMRQLMEQLLKSMLIMLSMIRLIPFSDDAAICDTLEYIRNNYAAQISVRELAAKAGFDATYFIRRFREIMGVTPYAYLRSYRLLRAGELIAGGATIAQAAEAVGYENASSLSRALKSIHRNP